MEHETRELFMVCATRRFNDPQDYELLESVQDIQQIYEHGDPARKVWVFRYPSLKEELIGEWRDGKVYDARMDDKRLVEIANLLISLPVCPSYGDDDEALPLERVIAAVVIR
jgi:hypothetical protein